MSKWWFRILVFLMSLSLIGIISIQFYWFKITLEGNAEQFKLQVKQVLGNVAERLYEREAMFFLDRMNELVQDGVDDNPEQMLEFGYYQRNTQTNETIIYSNTILSEDFMLPPTFFDNRKDSLPFKNFTSKRQLEMYNSLSPDKQKMQGNIQPDIQIKKSNKLKMLDKLNFEISLRDVMSTWPIQRRISEEELQKILDNELKTYGVKTPFEFGIYSKGLATKVRSENFTMDKNNTYSIPIFMDNEGTTPFNLYITFPEKRKFLLSEVLGITMLSLLFTLIIILAYANALNQLFRQKQISEIKTDFINNMTHEFKTPIATINLALDAIKNPKVIQNTEKVYQYLQMIKDENKRMHAQVENVLRISKLEKNEIDIRKTPQDVHELLQDAMDHVQLILADKEGKMETNLSASKTTALLNDMHFTNVFVNIMENAIKYSNEAPLVKVSTENIKDFILVKIQDNGIGMSKQVQKKIFDKFYREHTGDVHNVKGHGLGLAYVKKMIDLHQCEIFVESEKGKGSTFTIKIPIVN